jgi:hypothetical protein
LRGKYPTIKTLQKITIVIIHKKNRSVVRKVYSGFGNGHKKTRLTFSATKPVYRALDEE